MTEDPSLDSEPERSLAIVSMRVSNWPIAVVKPISSSCVDTAGPSVFTVRKMLYFVHGEK
jgi:hypothetical protein